MGVCVATDPMNMPDADTQHSPQQMLLLRLGAVGAGAVAAALLALLWPARWFPHALLGDPENWQTLGLLAVRFLLWAALLFVAAKLIGWLVTWSYQIALINGLQRLTGQRYRLSLPVMIALSPVVIPVAVVMLCVQLVIGTGKMLLSIGRWQCPPGQIAGGTEEANVSSPGWMACEVLLGCATVLSAAVCLTLLPTVIPPLRVPIRPYGMAASGLILLLLPVAGTYRRLRGHWPAWQVIAVATARVCVAVVLAGLLLWAVGEKMAQAAALAEGESLATVGFWDVGNGALVWLEWSCRVFTVTVLAAALGLWLFQLFVYKGLLSRPLAPRVRQFMADRLFRKKRIAIFSVLAVTLAVAMELIGVGVTNGMLEAVKDASRRVLADIVMEGPLEGIAYYDEFIEQVRGVTVTVDGRQVRAVEAVTPTIAGWGVARFQVGGIKRTYAVRVMGIRLNPAKPAQTQYDGVTRFSEGLLFRPHGEDARPGFSLPERYRRVVQRPFPGCIPGYDVLQFAPQDTHRRRCLATLVKLTTIPVTRLGEGIEAIESRPFTLLDFHQSGVYEFDSRHFYIDFDEAQELFAMTEQTEQRDGHEVPVTPPLCSRILFRIHPQVDVQDACKAINAEWQAFVADPRHSFPTNASVDVETWMHRQRTIINAFEQQKVLFILVFAVISIVAGFLIMAIFIMIVSEKTRDIGILKSLGASDSDVLRTFLSFALIIGVVGAAIGYGLASVFLHYINPIKKWLGDLLGVEIFGGDVWLFKDLPTELAFGDAALILLGSIVISVLAAYIPARRAAKLPPVRALSYE